MANDFVVESSSEYGINVRHTSERHLYLFAIANDDSGAKILAAPSVRAFKNAKHAPEDFQELARVFAEDAARSLGLIASSRTIDPIEPTLDAIDPLASDPTPKPTSTA